MSFCRHYDPRRAKDCELPEPDQPAVRARGRYITARYPGRCTSCRRYITPGARILYTPAAGLVYCTVCYPEPQAPAAGAAPSGG